MLRGLCVSGGPASSATLAAQGATPLCVFAPVNPGISRRGALAYRGIHSFSTMPFRVPQRPGTRIVRADVPTGEAFRTRESSVGVGANSPGQAHSCSDASLAPSAMGLNLAQVTLGCTVSCARADVENPQSVPASTFSRPTSSA